MSASGDLPDTAGGDLGTVDYLTPEALECPYALDARLRDKAPVHRLPNGVSAVTRYADVMKGMGDFEHYSRDLTGYFDPDRPTKFDAIWKCAEARRIFAQEGWDSWPQAAVLFSDPPLHSKFRKFVNPMFSRSRVKAMTPYIQALIDELIDGFIDKGETDFVRDFATPLPMRVICDRLGFPKEDLDRLKAWSTAMGDSVSGVLTPEGEVACARKLVEFQHYMVAQLERKTREPADDILTEIAQAGGDSGFDTAEILSLISSIHIGGNESTTNALASGMWLLLTNPDVMAEIRAKPELIHNFVEETLRLESPFQVFTRTARKDAELAGATFKQGDYIDFRLGAANRDERQFENPDKIDLHRKQPGVHLAFGTGIHFCLGNLLARLELNLAFETLLKRMININLAPQNTFAHMPHRIFRGLKELYLTFDKAP